MLKNCFFFNPSFSRTRWNEKTEKTKTSNSEIAPNSNCFDQLSIIIRNEFNKGKNLIQNFVKKKVGENIYA